jgi:acyl-CoA thioesterase-1
VVNGDDVPASFQADRIHPHEQAQPVMAENVYTALRPLLR